MNAEKLKEFIDKKVEIDFYQKGDRERSIAWGTLLEVSNDYITLDCNESTKQILIKDLIYINVKCYV